MNLRSLAAVAFASIHSRSEETKQRVRNFIIDNPGLYETEIARQLGINRSMARYYTRQLYRENAIHSYRHHGFRRFCASTLEIDARHEVGSQTYPETMDLKQVFGEAEISIPKIMKVMDWSRRKARYHVARMEKDGLLNRLEGNQPSWQFSVAAGPGIDDRAEGFKSMQSSDNWPGN